MNIYMYRRLWIGCAPVSNNTLEILYNPGTITKVYSQILGNAKNMWDFYADTKSLTIPFAIEQVNRAILDAKNRGVRIRFVTEVTKDNVTYSLYLVQLDFLVQQIKQ